MTDSDRTRKSGISLAELAGELGRSWSGDGEIALRDVAPLESAEAGDLAFVRSEKWASSLAESRASAVILPEGLDPGSHNAIHSPNPALDFARAVLRLKPASRPASGIHPQARVDPSAEVDPSASVGPGVTIGARARVGARTILHPDVTLYPDVAVGEDCEVHARVVIREGSLLGDRVLLQPGAVIGGDGFGYVPDETGALHRVPHVGRVVLEDDVEIGANATVDRGTLRETRVRRRAKIDNLVQIAHNCDIGEDVVVAAQSGFSGSTEVGRGAIVMAQVGVAGHLRIGSRAFVGARAGLHKDVAEGSRVWGTPQMEERRWHKAMAALGRLPDLLRRMRAVEAKLGHRDASATSSEASAPAAEASPPASDGAAKDERN